MTDLFLCPICAVFVDRTGLPLNPQPELPPKLGALQQRPCIGHRLQLSQERLRVRREVKRAERYWIPHKD